jgi:hypothetical protein
MAKVKTVKSPVRTKYIQIYWETDGLSPLPDGDQLKKVMENKVFAKMFISKKIHS